MRLDRLAGWALPFLTLGCGRSEQGEPALLVERPAKVNAALGLTFPGSARVRADHLRFGDGRTLTLRFLTAHTTLFRAGLVSDSAGHFHAALAPFGALGEPGLELRTGDTTTTLRLAEGTREDALAPHEPARWRTLGLSLAGDELEVTVDGRVLVSLAMNGLKPAGDLVLGRLAHPGAVADQFYGLIDDVTVFERSPSAAEVPDTSEAPAAIRFDEPYAALGGEIDGFTLHGAAEIVPVSTNGDAEHDRRLVPPPRHVTVLSPPFSENQIWRVLQSIDSGRSHRDEAAFALDLAPVNAAHGSAIVASADGEVAAAVDCFPDDNRAACPATAYARGARPAPAGSAENRNLVCLRHTPDEHTCYVHVAAQSNVFPLQARVRRGAVLARVGKTGTREPHLHFALSDLAESSVPGAFSELVTRPFVFDRYQVSNDEGRSWRSVSEALPRRGQWIRR